MKKGLINFKKCSKDRLTVEYIETKQELLETDWSIFKENNTKLYERFKLEDIEQMVGDIYDDVENTYIVYKSLMKTTLNKICSTKGSVQNANTSGMSKPVTPFVKLPKIAIPIFSGKYGEWTTFHDLFTSLVHKNDSLDNVQKMHYLKSHLSGEAEQLIRHTPITSANYSECWAQLDKRYNNKKYLTNCILKRLFGQKRINVESASSLKELLDTTCDCLHALRNLNINVNTWDIIIIHIVTLKLDSETRKQWELNVCASDSNNDLPTFEQFKLFIENRFRALEFLEPKVSMAQQVNKNYNYNNSHGAKVMLATNSSSMRCEYCSEPHKLCFCKKFTKQPVEGRREFVMKNRICFNCLGSNHTVYDCKKVTTCRVCRKRHHSLLHFNPQSEQTTSVKPTIENVNSSTSSPPIVSCLSTGRVSKPRQVLLATALIKVESKNGEYHPIRALLDQGSQACFITEAAVQFLSLKKTPIQGVISGLGENSSTIARSMVHLNIRSRVNFDFVFTVKAYVLNKITSYLPERSVNTNLNWLSVTNLCLADPGFHTSNKIDILLGADVYSHILTEGIIKNPACNLIAQNTTLGWVISGVVDNEDKERSKVINVLHAQVDKEDDILKRFWELEEQTSTKQILTPEEKACEEFYSLTTRRDESGRYIVRLPFREENTLCMSGNSRDIAEKRFKSLEKRLGNNKELKEKYVEVIQEYLSLGHMRPIAKDDMKKDKAFYLPHQAVVRDDKTTTKVRVVFNASQKNSTGVSLNDNLMVGPKLQADLRHTILRWRLYPIALVADIIKMYRQVRIAEGDAMFQRILWRDCSEKEIVDYELTTVTFGTASAPYQAVRTLHQVAFDEGDNYPLAKDKVLNCFYMDDLMTGCYEVDQGLEIYTQITELLGKGGFKLQKWNSNNQELIKEIKEMENEKDQGQLYINRTNKDIIYMDNIDKVKEISHEEVKEVEIKIDSTIKILGLTWNRSQDTFQYLVNLPPLTTAPATKRSIISNIARLFDPLGWIAPSIVLAKVFIQKLWLTGVSWDEELNVELVKEWIDYREQLSLLTDVRIPRWIGTTLNQKLELHGFSDASKTAYSAVIYLRTIDLEGKIHVTLIVAKTRVAPVKQISIPRLELCGAVLLSQLLIETANILSIPKDQIKAWTDSTVVLAWINDHPSRWKTFVANRTSEILTNMKASQWFHVSTKDNPADCASRGIW
nr:uncharacterized protein LOC113402535 [Vanessa tameamea]XP_026498685.1 uncharacterized protein LOC113402600 [Vanessa tameamea]XP_026500528.1 uncharacterized protein LOC113404014 [Vanessa tameamea]